jgi:hypothetical protein
MILTQNIHDPSSRLNAVAPFVNTYPLRGVVDILGFFGAALEI